MTMPVATKDEQRQSVQWWTNHLNALVEKKCVRHDAIMFASFANRPENIGYEQHQLRPGKMGQWDMYDRFMAEGFSEEERMLVCGLTAGEIADSNRRFELKSRGVDPDNPAEVAHDAILDAMTPEQLDAEIGRLEGLLASSPAH